MLSIIDKIRALSDALKKREATGHSDKNEDVDINQQFTEICRLYLAVEAEQQAEIRRFPHGSSFGWYVLEFIECKTNELASSKDSESLLIALAAAALCGKDIEFREMDAILQHLFTKAKSVGIIPGPYFIQIAKVASIEPGFYGYSPAELFLALPKKMRRQK